MVLSLIKRQVDSVLKANAWHNTPVEFWVSKNAELGHFVSNLPLVIARKHHLDSQKVADCLVESLLKTTSVIDKIVCKSGFLYFFCHLSALNDVIVKIMQDRDDFGRSFFGDKKTVNYEWVSANPTGYLHLGHARNIFVGHAITNLLSFCGFNVTREFYINDHGNQIYQLGKSVFFHYQKLLGHNPPPFTELYLNDEILDAAKAAVKFFGTKYQDFLLDDFQLHSDFAQTFITFGKDFFLNQMKKDLAMFGIHFDVWFSEKSLYQNDNLSAMLERLKTKKLIYLQDGAVWFRATNCGYNKDFVLIKKDKNPTYFTGDIMYHNDKYQRGYDLYTDLFGADHHSHYLKIKAGLKGLGWDVSKFNVDLLQMVKIVQDGTNLKISKRKGTSFPLNKLIKSVNLDYLRFVLLSRQKQTKFVFDLNSLKQNNAQNPFFYIQYAHARSCQILNKITKTQNVTDHTASLSSLKSLFEQNMILSFYQFPMKIEKATTYHEPQILVDYLLKLSKAFHVLYENVDILHSDSLLFAPRVALVKSFQQILINGLRLLGIQPKTKM